MMLAIACNVGIEPSTILAIAPRQSEVPVRMAASDRRPVISRDIEGGDRELYDTTRSTAIKLSGSRVIIVSAHVRMGFVVCPLCETSTLPCFLRPTPP